VIRVNRHERAGFPENGRPAGRNPIPDGPVNRLFRQGFSGCSGSGTGA